MAKIDIIGNILNNVIKGICLGNDLIALQGSARAGKTRNLMIMLIEWCLHPDAVNNLNRLKYLSQKKDREEREAKGEVFTDELREPKILKRIQASVVRLSMPSLKRSVFKDFCEVMLQMGIYDPRRMNKTEMVYTFANGSEIGFFATADNEQKVRGSSRDILFVNEANEIGEWEFGQLKMRSYSFSLVDFNPSFTEDHWLFKRIHAEHTYHFISTFRDNPFLPQAAVDEIESYKYTNPALWQIFGEGQFAIVEGLVFPKKTWDTITLQEIPVGVKPSKMGIDIGFSGKGDPTTAVLSWFWSDSSGVKHVCFMEVLYEIGLNEKQVASRIKQYNDIPKYIDSSNPLYIQNLEDSGLQLLYPVKKYANSVIDGITKMQGYKIHIIKTSTNLIKEFNNYCWMKDRHEQYTNTPIDKFNHGIDAARYSVISDRSGRFGDRTTFSKEELGFSF